MSMMWVGIGSAVVGAGTSIYGATQSAKNGRPPPPRNLGNELGSILGQANNFAGANYGTQTQFNPLLTQLNAGNYATALLGKIDEQAFLKAHPEFADGYTQAQAAGNAGQWLERAIAASGYINPGDVPRAGGAAQLSRSAFNAANPDLVNYTGGLQGVMDKLGAQAPGAVGASGYNASGYDAATSAPTMLGPAAMARFSGARATTANGGPLLNPLQRDAASNLTRLSPIQSGLQGQAMSLLNANGGLSSSELAGVQDSVRSAYADRGMLRSNSGIGAEILQTDAARRQRLLENANFASGVDASGQQQLQANRGYALNVQGQGQNLSGMNASLLTNTSTFNAGQLNNLGSFNAGQANQQAQYGASLLQNNNQYNAGSVNQARAFGAGAQNTAGAFNANATNSMGQFNAQLAAQNLNDQWARAMQYGGLQLSQAQNPMGLAGAIAGQVPDYTNSLLNYGSDVYNTNYNGAASAANSARNNGAAMTGSGLNLIGSGIGAYSNYQGMMGSGKGMFGCIPEGQRIDTPHGGVAIENLKPGMRVIGYDGLPVFVVQLHAYMEDPTQHRFVCIEFESGGHTLTVSDRHRIEGRPAADWQTDDVIGGRRIKHKTWHGGVRRSYDILTSDAGYRIHGVPTNSMIEEMAAAVAQKE